MLHAEEHPKHDGHMYECTSTTWEKCSYSAPRTPRVARVQHSGLASLSLAALYALRCGRGRVKELLDGEHEQAAGVRRMMTGTCTSGINDTSNMLMPDSSYTSRSRVARVQHGGLASLSLQRPCTPRPGGSSTMSGHTVNRRSLWCGRGQDSELLDGEREQELEAGARRVHPRWRCGTRANLSEQAEQAQKECAHDDGGW